MPGASPLHPATVHFPLAFLTASTLLDTYVFFRSSLPSIPLPAFLQNNLIQTTSSAALARTSYALLGAGLLTAIPAVISGGQQAVLMVNNGGLYENDGQGGKRVRQKMKTTIVHALGNDVALVLFGVKWWVLGNAMGMDYGAAGVAGALKGEGMGVGVGMKEVVLGMLAQVVVFWSASLGGLLTYGMGVGMSLGGKGKTA